MMNRMLTSYNDGARKMINWLQNLLVTTANQGLSHNSMLIKMLMDVNFITNLIGQDVRWNLAQANVVNFTNLYAGIGILLKEKMDPQFMNLNSSITTIYCWSRKMLLIIPWGKIAKTGMDTKDYQNGIKRRK
jgi:hypothetical protein